MTITETNLQAENPDARDYNRARRWVEIGDLVISFGFLIVLLVTGWTNILSSLATRLGRDHYVIDLFFYIVFLSVISKALGFGLDLYSFRLEHRFNLTSQRIGSWIKDEIKGWLLGLVMATFLTEIVYALIRLWPPRAGSGSERLSSKTSLMAAQISSVPVVTTASQCSRKMRQGSSPT